MRYVLACSCVLDLGVNPCGVCVVGWWLSFQVALQALYKQVGTLLPNVRALHRLHLLAVRTATAVASEDSKEGPKWLAVWTRPREGLALRCMVLGRRAQPLQAQDPGTDPDRSRSRAQAPQPTVARKNRIDPGK
jgi:hypothetical protein